MTLEVTVCHDK